MLSNIGALKKNFFTIVCFLLKMELFSLHRTTNAFLTFTKTTADVFVISTTIVAPFNINWLTNF